MIRFWNSIKMFLTNHEQHAWVEYHLLYFAIFGLVISIILFIIYVKKINKQIKDMDKKSRKIRKNIIKSLSKQNNSN